MGGGLSTAYTYTIYSHTFQLNVHNILYIGSEFISFFNSIFFFLRLCKHRPSFRFISLCMCMLVVSIFLCLRFKSFFLSFYISLILFIRSTFSLTEQDNKNIKKIKNQMNVLIANMCRMACSILFLCRNQSDEWNRLKWNVWKGKCFSLLYWWIFLWLFSITVSICRVWKFIDILPNRLILK